MLEHRFDAKQTPKTPPNSRKPSAHPSQVAPLIRQTPPQAMPTQSKSTPNPAQTDAKSMKHTEKKQQMRARGGRIKLSLRLATVLCPFWSPKPSQNVTCTRKKTIAQNAAFPKSIFGAVERYFGDVCKHNDGAKRHEYCTK